MSNKNKEVGSFLNGFTAGLVAGAAAYFLFATDKGKNLSQEIQGEWDQAKETLAEKGVIKDKNTTIRQLIGSIFKQVTDTKMTPASERKAKKLVSKKKKISFSSSKKKQQPKKFKGV